MLIPCIAYSTSDATGRQSGRTPLPTIWPWANRIVLRSLPIPNRNFRSPPPPALISFKSSNVAPKLAIPFKLSTARVGARPSLVIPGSFRCLRAADMHLDIATYRKCALEAGLGRFPPARDGGSNGADRPWLLVRDSTPRPIFDSMCPSRRKYWRDAADSRRPRLLIIPISKPTANINEASPGRKKWLLIRLKSAPTDAADNFKECAIDLRASRLKTRV